MAALRSGVDLVHAAASAQTAQVLRAFGPHLITHDVCPGPRLQSDANGSLRKLMARATAVLVGPGLGDDARTRRAAAQVLKDAARRDLPIVVDADGLDAVTPALLARHGHKMVLTPHTREFLDLTETPATDANVQAYAAKSGVTVLCKGPVRTVSDGLRLRWCRRGSPSLTVGGIGDVIAGCTGALLAKGVAPFDAACAAAYLVGCAGEQAAALWSYGATATEVADAIPAVLRRLEA
jgi:NAD(P)H-hydrate epimerase